jgi:hypothetical protein
VGKGLVMTDGIRFPVFVQDTDDCIYVFDTMESFIAQIEVIDIEDEEYRVWDNCGAPLQPFVDGTRAGLRAAKGTPRPDELRRAIIRFGNKFSTRAFSPSNQVVDPVTLFHMAEKFIRENKRSTFDKIKAWISKKDKSND